MLARRNVLLGPLTTSSKPARCFCPNTGDVSTYIGRCPRRSAALLICPRSSRLARLFPTSRLDAWIQCAISRVPILAVASCQTEPANMQYTRISSNFRKGSQTTSRGTRAYSQFGSGPPVWSTCGSLVWSTYRLILYPGASGTVGNHSPNAGALNDDPEALERFPRAL
jgi:hypothetical protein